MLKRKKYVALIIRSPGVAISSFLNLEATDLVLPVEKLTKQISMVRVSSAGTKQHAGPAALRWP